MASLLERIESAFGTRGFRHPMLSNYPLALRFDLAGDERSPARRFFIALERARTVARQAFAGSDELSLVAENGPGAVSFGVPGLVSQFSTPLVGPVLGGDPDESAPLWSEARFRLSDETLNAVLAPPLARDLNLEPRGLLGSLYLIDFDRRIALYAYDDRGMDVIAAERSAIEPLYGEFRLWALDATREMDAAFGGNRSRG